MAGSYLMKIFESPFKKGELKRLLLVPWSKDFTFRFHKLKKSDPKIKSNFNHRVAKSQECHSKGHGQTTNSEASFGGLLEQQPLIETRAGRREKKRSKRSVK